MAHARNGKQPSGAAGFAFILGMAFLLGLLAEAWGQTNWQKKWEGIVAAAKKEGTVVVIGPTSPEMRTEFTEVFPKRFGIPLDFITMGAAEARVRVDQETAARRYTIDLLIGGAEEVRSLLPGGQLEPIREKLILPEVLDMSKWRGGKIKYNDQEERYLIQATEYVFGGIELNMAHVKREQIRSWKELLNPQYKGKITSHDPRPPGPGQAVAIYLMDLFGPDFIKSLYVGQGVVMTRERRQAAEWLVRGVYPIGLGVPERDLAVLNEPVKAPIDRIFPPEAPGQLVGGSGVVKVLKNAPHPNGAVVFLNWFLTKEAQEIFARTNSHLSRRTDVDSKMVPNWQWLVPRPGLQYQDAYTYDYIVKTRPRVQKLLLDTLGR